MEHIKDFNKLISGAANYLDTQLFFKTGTVDDYIQYWKRIRDFMILNGFKTYDQNVEKQMLLHEFNGRNSKHLSFVERRFYNGIKMLSEFNDKGYIKRPPRPRKTPIVLEGAIGIVMRAFLDHKKAQERPAPDTLEGYRTYLSRFLDYCDKQGIDKVSDINLTVLLHFIGGLNITNGRNTRGLFTALRGFLTYAFEQKLLGTDYSNALPKPKSVNQPKLPSTYSEDEIQKMISSVERSSALGKRNYTIVLIAARLGFRAIDIANLKFENLHWDKCAIEIQQYKTGKELVVPLLTDIGNAIIDYLKYSRPKSDSPYVFVKSSPPHEQFSDGQLVSQIVNGVIVRSGIDIKGRKHGSHALRHSLASRMLEKSTMLPVISEVLGHANTDSTRYYLRIDFKSMKQCVLDVPPVPTVFYEQKGGAFYDEL